MAGTPNTFLFDFILFSTNEPAPTVTLFPISMLLIIFYPNPIQVSELILTLPAIFTPGEIWIKSFNLES